MKLNIAVAGAGISGMSTAFVLQKAGHQVTVYASAFSPDITSNRAAAFWFPYHIRNDKRGIDWCKTTYEFYTDFSKDPATGISMKQLIKVLRFGEAEEEPIWKEFMPANSVRIMDKAELKPDISIGYDVNVPLIETQIFLPWLKQQLEKSNVRFIKQTINDLDELSGSYDIVINCTALGSRTLCKDDNIIPIRGQVCLLKPGPSIPIYLDNEMPLYIVPRKDAIIVGGTFETGVEVAETEPQTIERILQNAYKVFPELAQQEVIGSWAGLRPYRADVRVEKERGTNIIHNYGHGGSGFTLAFGCATSVLDMVNLGDNS